MEELTPVSVTFVVTAATDSDCDHTRNYINMTTQKQDNKSEAGNSNVHTLNSFMSSRDWYYRYYDLDPGIRVIYSLTKDFLDDKQYKQIRGGSALPRAGITITLSP